MCVQKKICLKSVRRNTDWWVFSMVQQNNFDYTISYPLCNKDSPYIEADFILSSETGLSVESNWSCDALFYVVSCPMKCFNYEFWMLFQHLSQCAKEELVNLMLPWPSEPKGGVITWRPSSSVNFYILTRASKVLTKFFVFSDLMWNV
jgi:hypothetical protein